MERLSEFHFFQSHHCNGCRLPEFNNEENHLQTLLDWYDFIENGKHNYFYNRISLNQVQSIDFVHFLDLTDFQELLKDLHKIYIKSFPYSEITDFFDYTLSVTYYEIKELLKNERRLVWAGYTFNNYHFYYFINDSLEREFFCLEENININNLFHFYRKILKLIDDFIQAFTIKKNESEKNDIEIQPQLTLKGTPFINIEHLRVFNRLNERHNVTDKKRYTQFYLYLDYKFKDFNLGEIKFFDYINDNFQKIAKRKQATVYLEDIQDLFDSYLN
jgi:hypothetical protein